MIMYDQINLWAFIMLCNVQPVHFAKMRYTKFHDAQAKKKKGLPNSSLHLTTKEKSLCIHICTQDN